MIKSSYGMNKHREEGTKEKPKVKVMRVGHLLCTTTGTVCTYSSIVQLHYGTYVRVGRRLLVPEAREEFGFTRQDCAHA